MGHDRELEAAAGALARFIKDEPLTIPAAVMLSTAMFTFDRILRALRARGQTRRSGMVAIPDFDRILRDRAKANVASAEAVARAREAEARARRAVLWDEIRDLAPMALATIGRLEEHDWPANELVMIERKTPLGGYKRVPVAGFILHTIHGILGREQTSVTPSSARGMARIYLLSDARISVGNRPIDGWYLDHLLDGGISFDVRTTPNEPPVEFPFQAVISSLERLAETDT